MNYKILATVDKLDWDELLNRLPIDQQDIYFTSDYYYLYQQHGDGEAHCFVFEQEGQILLYPFLVNSINRLGYDLNAEYYDIQGAYGYNGIVTSCNNEKFLDGFSRCFYEYCLRNNIVTEFIRFHPVLRNNNISNKYVHETINRQTVVLNIFQPYDMIWTNSYSSNNRNMIRKANKLGYRNIIRVRPSLSELSLFYSNYTDHMKRVNADPYYYFNMEYFINLFSLFEGNCYLFQVIDKKGDKVCYSIFLHYKQYFHYHLSSRSINIDNCVNNYLLDEAVKFAKGLGANWFHFGGGHMVTRNDKLLRFKENFSKDKLGFYVGKKIINSEIYSNVVRQWMEKWPIAYSKNQELLQGYRIV